MPPTAPDDRTDTRPSKERTTHRAERTTPRKPSRRSDGERFRPAEREQRPTAPSHPQPSYFDEEAFDAETRNSGFDWSFFERGGNTWERPAKGKKRK